MKSFVIDMKIKGTMSAIFINTLESQMFTLASMETILSDTTALKLSETVG